MASRVSEIRSPSMSLPLAAGELSRIMNWIWLDETSLGWEAGGRHRQFIRTIFEDRHV